MKRILLMAIVLPILLAGCREENTPASRAEKRNIEAQMDVKARATASVPVPKTTNFQARKNLAEYMRRQDEPGKIWYVYERARQTGEIIGVYHSRSHPQSVCTFMTPPEEVKMYGWNDGVSGNSRYIKKTAIALDGVYYKGGDCPDFFFDYITNAIVVLDRDAVTIAVDKPLDIKAPAITFTEQVQKPSAPAR